MTYKILQKRVIFTTFSTYFLLSTLSWVGYCRCWFRYHPSVRSFASSPFESHKCCCWKSSAHTLSPKLIHKNSLEVFCDNFFRKKYELYEWYFVDRKNVLKLYSFFRIESEKHTTYTRTNMLVHSLECNNTFPLMWV